MTESLYWKLAAVIVAPGVLFALMTLVVLKVVIKS